VHLVLDNVSQEESNEELDAKLSANLSLTLSGSMLYMSAFFILKQFKTMGISWEEYVDGENCKQKSLGN